MNIDPCITCFTHCNTSIFCIQFLEICPLCQQPFTDSDAIPFKIPYPFVRAKQTSCAIIMKPSKGTFLNYYTMDSDLHIGISSSAGIIFEFDVKGLDNSNTDSWNQSLVIYQLKDVAWHRHWDNVLKTIYNRTQFLSKKYDEDTYNCYSFVLDFIRELHHKDLKAATSKEIFCQHFIIPLLKDACKYITLYRNVKDRGFFINS